MTWKFPCCEQARGVACGAPRCRQRDLRQRPDQAQQYDKDGRPYYGREWPEPLLPAGPHTRVYITTRSWLDAGTEVLPGDRKFPDYAFPPPYGYPTFARENNNRPIDRQPLNPPSDLGGFPQNSRLVTTVFYEDASRKCPALDRAFFDADYDIAVTRAASATLSKSLRPSASCWPRSCPRT